jgi:tetratricopeptide (TPR) repeat protein
MKLILLIAACSLILNSQVRRIVYEQNSAIGFVDIVDFEVDGRDRLRTLSPGQVVLPANPGKLPSTKYDKIDLLFRNSAHGAWAYYAAGDTISLLVPEKLGKDFRGSPKDAWRQSTVLYRTSKSDKVGNQLPGQDVLFVLPVDSKSLSDLCLRRSLLALVDPSESGFTLQKRLVAAVAKAFPEDPAIGDIRRAMLGAMQNALRSFDSGSGDVEALEQGLKDAEISEAVAPADGLHVSARKELRDRKTTLDTRVAILRALYAGRQWDAFLLAWKPFERHQWAFEDLRKAHMSALQKCVEAHSAEGQRRLQQDDYRYAWLEFERAAQLSPDSAPIRDDLIRSWTEFSLMVARETNRDRSLVSPGLESAIDSNLRFAERFKEERNFEEAMKSVETAEKLAPGNLRVLLKKADVLRARSQFSAALKVLDQVDLAATDMDRKTASDLRGEVLFNLARFRKEVPSEIEAAIDSLQFHKAHRRAIEALVASPEEPSFLFYAGLTSLLIRKREEGIGHLRKYLDCPVTLDSATSAERRRSVYQLLDRVSGFVTPSGPNKSWASAMPVQAGAVYDPVSLTFVPKVNEIRSKKTIIRYRWDGNQLISVEPEYEQQAERSENPFYFTYDEGSDQLRKVSNEKVDGTSAARSDPTRGKAFSILLGQRGTTEVARKEIDPDEELRAVDVVYANHPYVDPTMSQVLLGKSVAVGVAWNRYFHPFVWEGIHFYSLTYDDHNRVKTALELSDRRDTSAVPTYFEFDWDDFRLIGIRGYLEKPDPSKPFAPVYVRRLIYEGGVLQEEVTGSGGGGSKIRYKYDSGYLKGAHCDQYLPLDSKDREVIFVP